MNLGVAEELWPGHSLFWLSSFMVFLGEANARIVPTFGHECFLFYSSSCLTQYSLDTESIIKEAIQYTSQHNLAKETLQYIYVKQ
jgi:hypothetical protein